MNIIMPIGLNRISEVSFIHIESCKRDYKEIFSTNILNNLDVKEEIKSWEKWIKKRYSE